MLDANERKKLENAMRVNWVIWFFIFISLFIYVAVCHVFEKDLHGVTDIGDQLGTLSYALIGVAVSTFGIIALMRKLILRNPSAGGMVQTPKRIEGLYASALIVSLALAESIGIYGLVLFLLGSDYEMLYLFNGMAAMAMVLYRPKMAELEDLALSMNKHALNTSRTY